MRKPENLTGQVFGRLTAKNYITHFGPSQRAAWECSCSCGAIIMVTSGNLRSGNTQSCGCFRIEVTIARSTTHGLRHTPEYPVWHDMCRRCHDPRVKSYHWYGKKGIFVCLRWREDFSAFYADMGPRPSPKHSVERRDGNLGYSPENCYWGTSIEQQINKKNPARLISYKGENLPIGTWERRLGFKTNKLYHRIVLKGLSMEEALQDIKNPFR